MTPWFVRPESVVPALQTNSLLSAAVNPRPAETVPCLLHIMLTLSVADEKKLHLEGSSFGIYPASTITQPIARKFFMRTRETESCVWEKNKKVENWRDFIGLGWGIR